jgi:hypothetical protein
VIFDIMFTCCIFHNMILEDEQDVEGLEDIIGELESDAMPFQRSLTFNQMFTNTMELENT